MEPPKFRFGKHSDVFERIVQRLEIKGEPNLTLTRLQYLIQVRDNRHWLWKGRRYYNSNFVKIPTEPLTYSVAQCLATFPSAWPSGWTCGCMEARCVNPFHCDTFEAGFHDITQPVRMLSRYGRQYCRDFIPDIEPLMPEIVTYAFNPDEAIHAWRIHRISGLSLEASRKLADAAF